MYEVPHHINGEAVSSIRKLPIYHPAKAIIQGEVSTADKKTIDAAVLAANNAFLTWSKKPATERAKILFQFKAMLDAEKTVLAEIITREHGKTLTEARGSIQRGIDVVEFATAAPALLRGIHSENVANNVDTYSLHQPLGVCVGITPFNFPAMIPLWMFSMAIACGNTFILKPSEKDPSCANHLVKIAEAAGLPAGVVNVVHGDKETVDALITHPAVAGISFVGSSLVAEHVYRTASALHKRVQAFGGAKNHCIVLPDANMDEAAEAIVTSAYGSTGQRCMAISVVVAIGDAVAENLIARIKPRIANLKIGSGDTDVDMGPLVTSAQVARVKDYIASGKEEGAVLVVDGLAQKNLPETGYFMGASLFDRVTPEMKIYREEIFGPVLSIVRVAHFDEALALVNAHEYGNGTAIFTNNPYLARQFAEAVTVGMVGINVPVPVPAAFHSFGGWKRSVFADIGMYGDEAVRFYTRLKTVTTRWTKKDIA